jgi:hypothetical protein
MEQTLTFVLGAAFALGLICLGYTFFSVLRINKILNQLNQKSAEVDIKFGETHKSIDERFGEVERQIHGRMDNEAGLSDKRTEDLSRRIDELNRYVDSRFDKQAEKTASTLSFGNSVLMDKVEKMEELFKMQMDQFAKVTLNHSERLADLETAQKREEDQIDQINS